MSIEYEYEVAYSEIMLYPTWDVQQFKTAVEVSSYVLRTPSDIKVHHKLHNLEVQPSEQVGEGKKKQVWKARAVPAVLYESYMPEARKRLALGLFAPNKFEVEGYQGDMSSWKRIGQFFYELNKERDQLSPTMTAKVRELTKNATTEQEKIDILYRYMQENMRYVSIQLGIGGWQTFDALYVEKNKFGDCKALSNFMKAMLKVIDIPAYTAIVYGGRRLPYDVTEDFARPMFNHVILHIPSANYWLECTSTDNPPNHLGTFTEDRNVLLVTEEGGKLIRTPKPNTTINFEYHNTHIEIDAKGQAQLRDKVAIGGLDYDYFHGFLKYYNTEAEQKKQFLENSALPLSKLKSLNITLEKNRPIGNLEYELTTARYASRSGKRLFIPVNLNNLYTSVPDADNARINPILIRNNYIERDTILIQLPETAHLESIPKAVHIESDYGTYDLQFEAAEKSVRCFRRLQINALEIPANQYNDWRDFCKQIARKDKTKIVAKMDE